MQGSFCISCSASAVWTDSRRGKKGNACDCPGGEQRDCRSPRGRPNKCAEQTTFGRSKNGLTVVGQKERARVQRGYSRICGSAVGQRPYARTDMTDSWKAIWSCGWLTPDQARAINPPQAEPFLPALCIHSPCPRMGMADNDSGGGSWVEGVRGSRVESSRIGRVPRAAIARRVWIRWWPG